MKKAFCLILIICPMLLIAQKVVLGKVTDKDRVPLIGASILVKGTTNGQVSNSDGEFSIRVEATPATLIVSYLGFVSREIVINTQTSINVVLLEDQEALDEVVVIGYGEVNKKDLTGAVSSVKKKEDLVSQSNTVEELLQGRAAGVLVRSGFEPGAPNSIRIRGLNSFNR